MPPPWGCARLLPRPRRRFRRRGRPPPARARRPGAAAPRPGPGRGAGGRGGGCRAATGARAAAFHRSGRCARRQRSVSHRCRRRAAARVGPCAGRGVRHRLRRFRPRPARRALLGSGNKGSVYRIESPAMYTSLVALPATQVTAFQAGGDGRLYAATGNTGKVYEIGPGLEREGSMESDVFDSGMYSLWGRLSSEVNLNGGQVAMATRSGNLDRPQKNWSAWAAVPAGGKGGRVASPAARFVQWKATRSEERRVG